MTTLQIFVIIALSTIAILFLGWVFVTLPKRHPNRSVKLKEFTSKDDLFMKVLERYMPVHIFYRRLRLLPLAFLIFGLIGIYIHAKMDIIIMLLEGIIDYETFRNDFGIIDIMYISFIIFCCWVYIEVHSDPFFTPDRYFRKHLKNRKFKEDLIKEFEKMLNRLKGEAKNNI